MHQDKARILYIRKVLLEQTDENHPLTTYQLLDELKKYDIAPHRTTIPGDIERLKEFGVDVNVIKSSQTKYYVADRTFQIPELKLLIGAIESSKVITQRKSDELTQKLYKFAGNYGAEKLKNTRFAVNCTKPTNERIYYIIDVINEAISLDKQISFQHHQYSAQKKKLLRNNGKNYIVSPYNLVWSDDYYYLVCYSPKHNDIINIRVDRIATTPQILEEKRVAVPADFDINEHIKKMFYMYGGKSHMLTLKCQNDMMNVIVDRFGENVKLTARDENTFTIETDVVVSPTFFGWLFGFDGKIKIVSPQNVVDDYKRMLTKALKE